MNRLEDAYFERVYRTHDDPWGFETRDYERRKRDLTVGALRDHYRHIFEPGCSIGVLSALLARRGDRLTSTELVPRIACAARRRLAPFAGAEVIEAAIPDYWPEAPLDLVVFSEILYYLKPAGLDEVFAKLDDTLSLGGQVIAVHWRRQTDYPLTGDEVHDRLASYVAGRYRQLALYREDDFRLDLYERRM